MASIDLNSDLGEGYGAWRMGADDQLLDIVTSANIACGFHAGDPLTMRRTVRSAVRRGVAIGAHVSYPDLRGFGRRHMTMPPEEVAADVLYQLGALDALARVDGSRVRYVKPHGALYHDMAVDEALAMAVVLAIASYDESIPMLGMPDTAAIAAAQKHGLATYHEGFADRAYQADGRLVPRSQPGSVLSDPQQVAERALKMATERTVVAVDGSLLSLAVDTICIHGDSPDAVESARAVRAAMLVGDVALTPFTAV